MAAALQFKDIPVHAWFADFGKPPQILYYKHSTSHAIGYRVLEDNVLGEVVDDFNFQDFKFNFMIISPEISFYPRQLAFPLTAFLRIPPPQEV